MKSEARTILRYFLLITMLLALSEQADAQLLKKLKDKLGGKKENAQKAKEKSTDEVAAAIDPLKEVNPDFDMLTLATENQDYQSFDLLTYKSLPLIYSGGQYKNPYREGLEARLFSLNLEAYKTLMHIRSWASVYRSLTAPSYIPGSNSSDMNDVASLVVQDLLYKRLLTEESKQKYFCANGTCSNVFGGGRINEFQTRTLFKKYEEDQLRIKLIDYSETVPNELYLTTALQLSDYDFEKKGFSFVLNLKTSGMPFGNLVREALFLPMAEADAEKLLSQNESRQVVGLVRVRFVKVEKINEEYHRQFEYSARNYPVELASDLEVYQDWGLTTKMADLKIMELTERTSAKLEKAPEFEIERVRWASSLKEIAVVKYKGTPVLPDVVTPRGQLNGYVYDIQQENGQAMKAAYFFSVLYKMGVLEDVFVPSDKLESRDFQSHLFYLRSNLTPRLAMVLNDELYKKAFCGPGGCSVPPSVERKVVGGQNLINAGSSMLWGGEEAGRIQQEASYQTFYQSDFFATMADLSSAIPEEFYIVSKAGRKYSPGNPDAEYYPGYNLISQFLAYDIASEFLKSPNQTFKVHLTEEQKDNMALIPGNVYALTKVKVSIKPVPENDKADYVQKLIRGQAPYQVKVSLASNKVEFFKDRNLLEKMGEIEVNEE